MKDLDVRIVRLEPMRVASALGYGPGPEPVAWAKLLEWVHQTGLMEDGTEHRYYGFNNPNPSPGTPNYGYEQWVTIGPDTEPGEGIACRMFEGGLYAVTRCTLDHIGEVWQALAAWVETSPYDGASHQWLEGSVDPPKTAAEVGANPATIELDLYFPIAQ